MDQDTLEKYRHLAQKVKSASSPLSVQEMTFEVLKSLHAEGLRIEQEQIPWTEEWDFKI